MYGAMLYTLVIGGLLWVVVFGEKDQIHTTAITPQDITVVIPCRAIFFEKQMTLSCGLSSSL